MYRRTGTRRDGRGFSEMEIQAVWNKGAVIPGFDARMWRRDVCGAVIQRTQYGNTASSYGWEVDHDVPVSRGGSDSLDNLQPLHWENNRAKGDSYPYWECRLPA